MQAAALKYDTYNDNKYTSGQNAKFLAALYRKYTLKVAGGNEYNRYPNINIDKSMFVPVEIMDDEKSNKSKPSTDDFKTNLKIGIMRSLYAKQLITEKQMDKAILKLKQEVYAKC